MTNFFFGSDEILPANSLFLEHPPSGIIAIGILFLLLFCFGIAADIGLVIHWVKQPVRFAILKKSLLDRVVSVRMLFAVLGVIFGFCLLTSLLYRKIFLDEQLDSLIIIFQALVFNFPVLGLIALFFRVAGIKGKDFFGVRLRTAPTQLGLALLFYLASLPLVWFYSAIYQIFLQSAGCDLTLQNITQVLMYPAPWPMRATLFFVAILVAPVFEEVVFRGILLPFFVRRVGFWSGTIVLSLLFAGLHAHLPSLFPLFLLSMLFSLAYAHTRSLLVPIGMHVAFNGISVLFLFSMGGY